MVEVTQERGEVYFSKECCFLSKKTKQEQTKTISLYSDTLVFNIENVLKYDTFNQSAHLYNPLRLFYENALINLVQCIMNCYTYVPYITA